MAARISRAERGRAVPRSGRARTGCRRRDSAGPPVLRRMGSTVWRASPGGRARRRAPRSAPRHPSTGPPCGRRPAIWRSLSSITRARPPCMARQTRPSSFTRNRRITTGTRASCRSPSRQGATDGRDGGGGGPFPGPRLDPAAARPARSAGSIAAGLMAAWAAPSVAGRISQRVGSCCTSSRARGSPSHIVGTESQAEPLVEQAVGEGRQEGGEVPAPPPGRSRDRC